MLKEEKRGKKQRDKFIVHYIKCGYKRNTEKRFSIMYRGFKAK